MNEKVILNNGVEMPSVGLGTFLMKPEEAEEAVYNALTSGHRLIDTANAYMNERAVGRGMKRSGLKREDIFLETKLWPTVYSKATAIDETLERLDTDYIDLLLLHQPTADYKAAYQMMEEAVKAGKVRAIGLSNFEGEPLQEILKICEIKPAVIQVEAHPYYPQNELKDILKEHDIKIQAWYPLGHGDRTLLEEPLWSELAEKYGKTNAQIILRWHVQSGNIIIPGSKNPEHIKDNADIFDFALTNEEMQKIAKLNKNKRYYIPNPELLASYATMELKPELDV
ncbi:aldo/keto reductase [Massilimicrobiota sp. SW1139]|uniref:aldo/keto reductase n=1 Tax=Massilimicrobiota sp. SW1139 TaxID=2530043 RepID=UPI0014387268|nr:aldo/keto reductase [Massilimicrobiota sp. SW1139]NJE44769.1 aldo/keto reductase [Massilimicrobiota sp. SW1139]